MRITTVFSFLIMFFFLSSSSAQEICDNGIDDNADGLIDIMDTVACGCHGIHGGPVNVQSLIPNPSFEDTVCCPNWYSQMNCASGWIQANSATSDYMNDCNFVCLAAQTVGLNTPFPNGHGIVGTYVCQDYKEYVGACLTQPMLAGTSYTLQMSMASTPADANLVLCGGGVIYYDTLDVTIYGSTSCSNMPFPGFGCPPASTWQVMGVVRYAPVSTWGLVTISFTPTVDMYAIIIGPPCILPPSYHLINHGCSQYFYYDNLILNSSSSFSPVTVQAAGAPCHNNLVLNSHADTAGGTWQWYKDGAAIVGQTDSVLNVSANSLGTGVFTARYSLGNDCQFASDTVVLSVPDVSITAFTNASCSGGNDGSVTASASGGAGGLVYAWNTTPVQSTPTISNLAGGTYVVTITDIAGCADSDSVTITQGQSINVNNPQSLCGSGSYTINGHVYTTSGTYIDTLSTSTGCDSVVTTQLTLGQSYSINNPQTICNGHAYTINSHSYYINGTYIDTIPTASGCDSVITTQLLVNQIYKVNNPQVICDGQSYAFNSHVYDTTGDYDDTLQTAIGCDSIVHTILVSQPLPVLTFTHPSDLCVDGVPIPLNFATPPGGTYVGTGVTGNDFDPSISSVGIHPITYWYTDPVTNCKTSIDQHITVYSLPEVEFTLNPKIAYLANNGIAYVDYTSGGYVWSWDFGDSTTANDKHGFHHYNDTGYYDVSLVVIDDHGCMSSAKDNVYIGLEFAFNIPNAFTPNGDGKNETFLGEGIGIKKYNLAIYNRWGTLLFHTDNLYQSWSGADAPADSYIYKVNLEDITGVDYEYVGHVSIIR